MSTTEKILQTMNSWQSGEVIAVRRKNCSGASSHPNGHKKDKKCTQLLTRNIVNANLHRCHNCYTHALPSPRPSQGKQQHTSAAENKTNIYISTINLCVEYEISWTIIQYCSIFQRSNMVKSWEDLSLKTSTSNSFCVLRSFLMTHKQKSIKLASN